MSSEIKPLWLGTPATTVISLEVEPGVYSPAIGMWLPNIESDVRALLMNDTDAKGALVAYITNIEALEDGPLAIITFRLAHDEFENMDQVNNLRLKVEFSLTVPVQFIALAHALSLVPEGFPICVFESEAPIGASHHSWNTDDMFLALEFPPINTISSEEFSDEISLLITDSYHAPLFPVAFDEVDPSQFQQANITPLSIRKAQGVLLSIIAGLARGNESALTRLLKMENWIDTYYQEQIVNSVDEEESDNYEEEEDDDSVIPESSYEDESSEEGTETGFAHNEFMESFLSLMGTTYQRSSPDSLYDPASQEIPELEMNENTSFESDAEFDKIFKSNEFAALFNDVPSPHTPHINRPDLSDKDLMIADPFKTGFPASMKTLEKFFEKDGEAFKLADLLRWDWSRGESTDVALKSYSFSSIVIATIIVSAARASRIQEITAKTNEGDTNITVSLLATMWLSVSEDTNMWEIPAFSPALVDYDIESFADLMGSVVGSPDGAVAIYLPYMLHGIGHLLQEEEWTASNLDARLALLDVKMPSLPHARRILYYLLDEMNTAENDAAESDDDDDDDCPSAAATRAILDNEEMGETSKIVALIIPLLADINAARANLDVGSAEWKKDRKEYISNFLHQVSAQQPRVFW